VAREVDRVGIGAGVATGRVHRERNGQQVRGVAQDPEPPGETTEPRVSTGPPPSLCSPSSFFSIPGWSVAKVTSTAIAIAGSMRSPATRAPPP
jgi:hypothetical protein